VGAVEEETVWRRMGAVQFVTSPGPLCRLPLPLRLCFLPFSPPRARLTCAAAARDEERAALRRV